MGIRVHGWKLVLAAAALAAIGDNLHAATLTWDSSGSSPAAPLDGGGNWDTSTPNWSNGAADQTWPNDNATTAIFGDGNGAAGTVTLAAAITANGIIFDAPGSGSYTIAGSDTLSFAGTTPTITVAGGQSPTISAPVAGSSGITVAASGTGAGTLTLAGTNTFTGGLVIGSNAQVNFTANANLGGSGSGVTLNGGTLNYAGNTSSTPTITHLVTIGSAGGTIETQTAGGNGKFTLNSGGALAGNTGGAFTKTGGGWLTIYAAAASGSNFTTNVNGGVVELGSSTGLGSGAVTLNAGGELSSNTTSAVANNITVNGGTLSADFYNTTATTAANYSGTVTFAAGTTSSIRLGDFYQNQPYNMTISGLLAGSGAVNLINSTGGSSTGQLLTLTGNNSNFTGTLNIDPGHGVTFGSPSSTSANVSIPINGQLVVTSSATALPVVGYGGAATTGNPSPAPFAITDNTGAYGGVFAYNGGAYNYNLNLATLYDGNWFLGSVTGGSYYGSTLTPGFDSNGNPLYRLGGGGSSLNMFAVLGDANNSSGVKSAASVQVGDPRVNGGGTIKYDVPMTYTGGTSIVNGTLQLGGTGALPITTLVTFGAAANSTTGTAASNGTLDLNGLNTPVGGLAVAPGASAAGQIVTNSSSSASSVLTVDTSHFSSTFAGVIKNGTSKTIGLTVQGSTAGNSLTLTGANTYTGATSINNGGELIVNGSLANTTITTAAGGTLAGLGSIAGAITSGGTLAPGGSAGGALTVSNAVSLSNNSALSYALNSAGAPGGSGGDDLLAISGSLTLGQDITLDLTPGSSFGAGSYELASFTSLTDNSAGFTGWSVAGLPAGDSATFRLNSNTLDLNVSATPEPSSLICLLLGGLPLLARRKA